MCIRTRRTSCRSRRADVDHYRKRAKDLVKACRSGGDAIHSWATRWIEALLERGASVNVNDAVYGTPPLVWALHAWLVERRSDADAYRIVLRLLADAGAEVKPEWIDDDRLRADRSLYAALSRRVAPT